MTERGQRKVRVGRVTSDKADKTIVVAVETLSRNNFYKKTIKQTKKFMADDPKNEAKIGDLVQIVETRPLSKMKRWRFESMLEKAEEI
ncbi:MAG: 30S ribosomal protein S17 [Actinomycetia bacterium]|nr:30S ribosomal protein S17 [Actinomycetes bacterium]